MARYDDTSVNTNTAKHLPKPDALNRRYELIERLHEQACNIMTDIDTARTQPGSKPNWLAIADGLKKAAELLETAELLNVTYISKCPECGHRFGTSDSDRLSDAPPTWAQYTTDSPY